MAILFFLNISGIFCFGILVKNPNKDTLQNQFLKQ